MIHAYDKKCKKKTKYCEDFALNGGNCISASVPQLKRQQIEVIAVFYNA